jgi:hypothetical protein
MFDVVNGEPSKKLRVAGRPHCFFRRLRIIAGGTIIEDIDQFNRVSELFHILQSPQSRVNDSMEGFGHNHKLMEMNSPDKFQGFDSYQTVMFKPLCGILSQTKYLPLRYTPLEFELELVSDPKDPLININIPGPMGGQHTPPYQLSVDKLSLETPIARDGFITSNTSQSWTLQNFMIKVDMCTLDNALDNSYVAHVMSGKTLNIVYNTFISSLQTVLTSDVQINVSRSLTKLKSIFMTLDNDTRHSYYNKSFNNFWSPMSNAGATSGTYHIQDFEIKHLQLQIGSKLYPEYPIKSHAECFYSLRKALGVQANNMHSIDIDGVSYRDNRFIVGFDTERLLGLAFTGTNTRNSLMTMHLKTNEITKADRMHIVLLTEQILEIGGTICTVYD